jgi:hypothetical protein
MRLVAAILSTYLIIGAGTQVEAQPVLSADKMPAVSCQTAACPGVGSYPVNASYASDTNGPYCLVPNIHEGRFNFSNSGERLILPDPSVMTYGGEYWATGTSDNFGVANFALLASSDLTDWRLRRMAFSELSRSGDRIRINGREFKDLWAPHLYVDPLVPSRIFISFSATECFADLGNCNAGGSYAWQTVFVASISRTSFGQGGFFASASDGGAAEPRLYGYRVNNDPAADMRYDGGWAQGAGMRLIPTSATRQSQGPLPGQLATSRERPGFLTRLGFTSIASPPYPLSSIQYIEDRTFAALDSYVFFDPQEGNRRRLLYVWEGGIDPRFEGFNIASFPLISPYELDAKSYELLPHSLNRNVNNWPAIYNGCFGETGTQTYCISEGPAVFFRKGWYYLVFTRNPTSAQGYNMVYRKARSFRELAMAKWDDELIPESQLVYSSERNLPANERGQYLGRSYGHGEVFKSVAEDRYYLIFHQKDSGTSWTRSPMIKELSFNEANGEIESVSDGDSRGKKNDLNWFLIPRMCD